MRPLPRTEEPPVHSALCNGFGNVAYHTRANRTTLGFDSGTSIVGIGTVRKRVQRSAVLRSGNVRDGHSDVHCKMVVCFSSITRHNGPVS